MIFIMAKGISPESATQIVRMKRTGSVQTKAQDKFLMECAHRLTDEGEVV